MNPWLDNPILYLKGVGPQRAKLLQDEIGISTIGDLLYYFPYRYIDRSQYHTIQQIPGMDAPVQLKGEIISIQESSMGKQKRLTAKFKDTTGIIDLVWFQGYKYILPNLSLHTPYQVFGKAKQFGSNWSIPHPEITPLNKVDQTGWQPVYSTTEKLSSNGLNSRGIQRLIEVVLPQIPSYVQYDTLPSEILSQYKFPALAKALQYIHHPSDVQLAQKARARFKFEELLNLQLELFLRKSISLQKNKGHVIQDVGTPFHEFYDNYLPFPLTNAQKRVLKEIRKDMGAGVQMNRLLQGDVGSGKTIVALLTALMGIGSGLQGALMAPTEILANQHYEGLKSLLEPTNIRIELLTGSTKKAQRKILHEDLLAGKIHILVGTHALLEDVVQFQNLGIVIIDEQHRFGVAQRARLWKKNETPPHILVMTATPIPRTLAMTFYGDLDVSVIDELPPGRKPITTRHHFEKDRSLVFGFMRNEIALGRQIYIVYPLIQESESMDYNNLMDGYEAISKSFPLPDYKVSIVHGKMKPEAKDYEMQQFVNGHTQIMVATTVIEVGVNVPNASVMIIESAERFGLSQLHQLRGRVGRGAEQSYCLLLTGNKLSQDTKKRISTMVRTNDGFEISEVDLELRGPGDILGTQQSGSLDLKIADLVKDGPLVAIAREKAKEILEKDKRLELPENYYLRLEQIKRLHDKPNWAEIS